MKLFIVVFMFVILVCLLIISNNNLSFSNSEDVSKFGDLFVEWLGKVFVNFKDITGQTIGMD